MGTSQARPSSLCCTGAQHRSLKLSLSNDLWAVQVHHIDCVCDAAAGGRGQDRCLGLESEEGAEGQG